MASKREEKIINTQNRLSKLCHDCAEYDDGEKCLGPCLDFKQIGSNFPYMRKDSLTHTAHDMIWGR